jgi:cleavage stimulation factor subunit 2
MSQQKNDIFVGNLDYATTEDQLHALFSEVGELRTVKLMMDPSTGVSKGFGFVEYMDPNCALSAIRNMNGTEINGRGIRVNFSNNSHLETLANKLGMDMTRESISQDADDKERELKGRTGYQGKNDDGRGKKFEKIDHDPNDMEGSLNRITECLEGLSKTEMFDVLTSLKELADSNQDEARMLLTSHPMIPEAVLYIMSKLDMIQTPLPQLMSIALQMQSGGGPPPLPSNGFSAYTPGGQFSAPPPPPPGPPPGQPPQFSAPPPMFAAPPPSFAAPPPSFSAPPSFAQPPLDPRARGAAPPAPPPGGGGISGINPALVQQVMGLSDAQIAQLPDDKRGSILALKQQILKSQK